MSLKPVVQICQMVEGMPLGIELAAAWVDVLTPLEIMAEITHSLDFLAVNWPDRPERQHSLRAIFDSSWRLLAEAERAALMDLTLFQGSFSREAAQAVSGASIQLLMSLHSKSWLQVQDNGRYQIHELLCQYANEKLQAEPGHLAACQGAILHLLCNISGSTGGIHQGSQAKGGFRLHIH